MNVKLQKEKTQIFFAPMAGVSDYAYRHIVKEFHPSLMFTEMVSAKALYYNDKKTQALLKTSEYESPVHAQIFGHDKDIMAHSAAKIEQMGFCGIDINAGCPTPKITSNGDGCALMKNPVLLGEIIEKVKKSVSVPVSVKLRLGFDSENQNAPTCAKIAQESGASFITVHGRTRDMFYSGSVNHEKIKEVVNYVSIPVIANGDIFDFKDAISMIEKTGAYGVMVARGALGNPWIFQRINNVFLGIEELPYPDVHDKIEMALKHLYLLVETKGEHIGVLEARKHTAWYLKGIRGSAEIKDQIFHSETKVQMEIILSRLIDDSSFNLI